MKSKMILILLSSLILTVSYLIPVNAVTDAELEALEKQIEQLEVDEKKKAEAKAKHKAKEKRKAEEKRLSELEKQRLEEEQKRLEVERRNLEEEKRKLEEARLTELKRKRQEEETERQQLAAEEVRLKKEANEKAIKLAGEMVDVPGGSYQMGSNEGKRNEKPVHTVTIKPFKMGKHEVTFDHWDACVSDGGCFDYSPIDHWGRGNRPVKYVSWDGAQTYIVWLNRKTNGGYRLPSEAEWEYATRAGAETKYSWGNDIGRNHANCMGCGSQWDDKMTAPVGSFPANAFGLHDMHGNVSEFTQDCWHDNYNGAPSDGSAWEGGNCARRVIRGGSWGYGPGSVRSAYRDMHPHNHRWGVLGFRLAQDK